MFRYNIAIITMKYSDYFIQIYLYFYCWSHFMGWCKLLDNGGRNVWLFWRSWDTRVDMLILPCIMIQCNKNGLIIVSIYVDDNFCVGHKKALMEFVIEFRKHGLIIKVDYLSCKIMISKDGENAWIGQPHLSKKLEKKFGSLVENLQSYRTPGTPGNHIIQVQDNWLQYLLKTKLSTKNWGRYGDLQCSVGCKEQGMSEFWQGGANKVLGSMTCTTVQMCHAITYPVSIDNEYHISKDYWPHENVVKSVGMMAYL